MRTAIAVFTLTLIGGTTESGMSQTLPADVGSGRLAWFDLTTTNLARSQAFYGSSNPAATRSASTRELLSGRPRHRPGDGPAA
jgi:hypothetical protein